MSGGDVEGLRRAFDAFARGDTEAAFSRLSPDFELCDHLIPEDIGGLRGAEAFEQNLAMVREGFDRISWDVLETIDLGGRVLVRVLARGQNARLGALEIEHELGQLWTIRDGLATRLEIYPTWEAARAAAGVDDAR